MIPFSCSSSYVLEAFGFPVWLALGNYVDKCAIDDFLDGAPQFRHSSMPCLSRGQARAMPIVRNCSCTCEQPVTILTQKGLPFNTKGIMDRKQHSFKEPPSGTTRCTIHIAGVHADTDIKDQAGRLHRISPEEPVHAFLWGAAEYFSSEKLNDETTEKWIALIS